MNILCPECGGNKTIDLGNNMYKCRYCGKEFQLNGIPHNQQAIPSSCQPQPVYTQQPQPVYTQQSQLIQGDTQSEEDGYHEGLEELYAPGCLILGISFFIPLVGIILFFVKRRNEPIYAKICLQYAVISIIVGFIIGIIMRVMLTYYVL